jgi:hypothetical protein
MPDATRSSIVALAAAAALAVLVLDAGTARAQAPAAAEQPPPRRVVSVTISPFHLFAPIVELTAEGRAHDKVGVALIGGAGKISQDETTTAPAITASVLEIGLQGRYYLLGDFRHGLQLGAEALYLHLGDVNVDAVSAYADGIAVGPFLGYKYTADIGFTFDGQLGFQRVGLAAEAKGNGQTASSRDSDYIVLLNLNVGWSL